MERTSVFDDVQAVLGRAFYPVAILGVIAVLVAVRMYLQLEFVVFGLYALFGLTAGAAIYYGTTDVARGARFRVDEPLCRTGVYVASAVTVGLVAITDQPLFVFGGLAVGAGLIVHQLLGEPSPGGLVPQITALFMLSPLTKYLTAGQYVGHADVLQHVRFVDDLLASGSLGALSATSYQDFPGLHLIAAAAGSLSGLGAYDGLMLVGLAAYVVVIPAVYLVVARLTGHELLALCTALALAVVDDLSFFASYVFPQSIATVLVVILAVLATLVSRDAIKWRVAGLFVLVTLALSVTHHLTQVLFVPVVALALFLYAIRGRSYAAEVLASRQAALLGVVGAVTALRLLRTGFLSRLAEQAAFLVQGGPLGGYTRSLTLAFGRSAWERSVWTALEWLASPYGVYLVLLVLAFSVGIVAFLRSDTRSPVQASLFWTGAIGAILVFETPLSVQSLIRIGFPWLFVFAFVLGIGLLQLRQRVGTATQRQVVFAVIVALAAVGPMVTADDYYDLDPRPTVESSFSEAETAELEALAGYVEGEEVSPASLWLTNSALSRFGVGETRDTRVSDGEIVLPAGHFVYRSAWADHKVHFTATGEDALYSNTLYVSDGWLDRHAATGNKVYAAGGLGVKWRPTERPFAEM